MLVMGFESIDSEDFEIARCYIKDCGSIIQSITIKDELIDEQGNLKDIRGKSIIEKYLIYQEEEKPFSDDDSDIPF